MDSPMNQFQAGLGKSLVCVEYPGRVVNVDKMINTLGGIKGISTAYCEKNRRLELRFRPDDVYCKPTCGDKHQVSAVLLKVKVRRKKLQNETITTKASVVGKINLAFKFSNMCDFQYLPMHAPPNDPTKMECIYQTLVPEGMAPYSWILKPAMYFLPPAAFSRMDTFQGYMYRKDAPSDAAVPHNIIGKTRRRRSIYAIFVTFDVPHVPKKPRDMALKLLRVKFLEEQHQAVVLKLFEERPVWSKYALMCRTKFSRDQLKFLLPTVAFYFVTGPWRVMWVRFGYDPRKDTSSRIYQTLDYRLRRKGGLKTKVKAKRSYTNYLLPYKLTPACQAKVALLNKELPYSNAEASLKSKEDSEQFRECNYVFKPGMVPPSRQMFYQYCDVYVPEIQDMMQKLPLPLPDVKCHERDGWLPSGFADQCREIINNLVIETLKTVNSSDETICSEASTSRKSEDLSDSSDSEEQDEEEDIDDVGEWEVDTDDLQDEESV